MKLVINFTLFNWIWVSLIINFSIFIGLLWRSSWSVNSFRLISEWIFSMKFGIRWWFSFTKFPVASLNRIWIFSLIFSDCLPNFSRFIVKLAPISEFIHFFSSADFRLKFLMKFDILWWVLLNFWLDLVDFFLFQIKFSVSTGFAVESLLGFARSSVEFLPHI